MPQARRSGAVVATDKKVTAGGNKAHQGGDSLIHERYSLMICYSRHRPPTYSKT
jgi:putative transcription factor